MSSGHERLGDRSTVHGDATVGYEHDPDTGHALSEADAHGRAGAVIYGDIHADDRFTTCHSVLVSTNAVIDGHTTVGSAVSLQSNAYLPAETDISDQVFVGPGAALTNDPYPAWTDVALNGPTIEDGASVGANSIVLPGVSVGEDVFVAADAVVCEDIPPRTLVAGVPAEARPLPEPLSGSSIIA